MTVLAMSSEISIDASSLELFKNLSQPELKELIETELRDGHLLSTPDFRRKTTYDPSPTEALLAYYSLSPRRIKKVVRTILRELLVEWANGSAALSGGWGLRRLFNVIELLHLQETKPYLQQILLDRSLPRISGNTLFIHIFNAAAALTDSEDIDFWVLVAEQSPHHRHLIFDLLRKFSYEDALVVIQGADLENVYVVDYLTTVAPNFRDFLMDPERRPPDLVFEDPSV